MTPVAELRVYLPLDALPDSERVRWARAAPDDPAATPRPPARTVVFEAGRLELLATAAPLGGEGAYWLGVDDRLYVCPWRTQRRALVAVLAARQQFPEAVVDGIVSAADADRAAAALEAICRSEPAAEVQILESAFHVPVRWFAAFDDGGRRLIEDESGLSLRYETSLAEATARLERARAIVQSCDVPTSSVTVISNLADWLASFGDDGRLELEYGGVAGLFPPDEVADDHSAADLWATLGALEQGAMAAAGERWRRLADRWSAAQARVLTN